MNAEVLSGMKMIELIKDPTSINTILAEINDIVFNPDYKYSNVNFEFMKSEETNIISLSLLERICRNDKKRDRFKRLQDRGYMINIRNCIGYNLNMESIIETRMYEDDPDYPTMNIFLKQIFKYDDWNVNEKYGHMMRLLPMLLKDQVDQVELNDYFRFLTECSPEDENHSCVNIIRDVPDEISEQANLKKYLSD